MFEGAAGAQESLECGWGRGAGAGAACADADTAGAEG